METTSDISNHELDFVLPDADDRRRPQLLPLLSPRALRAPGITREEVESYEQPANNQSEVRFNYTYDELTGLADELTPGKPEDERRVARYALIWSGLRVADSMLHWASIDHGYKPGTRLPRVTMPIDNKRLSIRVVPDNWDGQYNTPFSLQRLPGSGVSVEAANSAGESISIAHPNARYSTESVQTLAYLVNLDDGKKNITINPLQRCPQSCEFCCRGYHDMTTERKRELINLEPDEMARALRAKFPNITDWSEVSGISLVTGDFMNEDDILDYLERFTASMDKVTSGQWNSAVHPHQDITISTHLIKSQEAMERAKKLGMRRFIHTVEMVDDATRENVMHLGGNRQRQPTPLNKGHMTFSGVLGVLGTAMEVFEPGEVEPVLVIGLDPLERTKAAMEAMKNMGVTKVSRGLVNVYDMNQFGLIPTSFEDAIAGMQYARDLFDSAYRRRITDFTNPGELRDSN